MFIQARSRKRTSDFKREKLIELRDLFFLFGYFSMHDLYKQKENVQ